METWMPPGRGREEVLVGDGFEGGVVGENREDDTALLGGGGGVGGGDGTGSVRGLSLSGERLKPGVGSRRRGG